MPADSQAQAFDRFHIDQQLLRQRAFNLRWATVDEDVIPLTAADPDFPVAAEIREVRPPEPYKGKGIKYVEEYIRRKAGKTVAAQ